MIVQDKNRFQQVLLNLLTNANKFTENGLIEVTLACQLLDILKVTVSDEGIGIEEADHSKLFNPYTQLETSKHLNPNGVGLGLSICKKIVEQLNGQIWIEQDPQIVCPGKLLDSKRGAAFSFTLKLMFASSEPVHNSQRG